MTGIVTGVTTGVANTFGPRQNFTNGISSAGASFSQDINIKEIRIGNGPATVGTNLIIGACGAGASGTTGGFNIGIGRYVLALNRTGELNTAIGNRALENNQTSSLNVAVGNNALRNGITHNQNVAIGSESLRENLAEQNTAIGYGSLVFKSNGSRNVGVGSFSGVYTGTGPLATPPPSNTSSDNSIFIGYDTRPQGNTQTNQIVIGHEARGLGSNTTVIGNSNTITTNLFGNLIVSNGGICASGGLTLGAFGNFLSGISSNGATFGSARIVSFYGGFTSSDDIFVRGGRIGGQMTAGNIAIGQNALNLSAIGANNISIGRNTLDINTTGAGNVAIGNNALDRNKTGANNVAIGNGAGDLVDNGSDNIIIGYLADIGPDAGFSGSTNSIAIGNVARGDGSNTTVIGNSSITSTRVFGTLSTNGGVCAAGATFAGLGVTGDIFFHGARVGSTLGTAPKFFARAWVNFDGNPIAIRSSGNVSSITDNGVGLYTVNFATSMGNTGYCPLITVKAEAGVGAGRPVGAVRNAAYATAVTTSALQIVTAAGFAGGVAGVTADFDMINVAIFN